MSIAAETRRKLRFACTSCGACCNRSPEVGLSEAAALADMFVFRLMFRIYKLPRTMGGHLASAGAAAGSSDLFYERKRLLTAFAAHKSSSKRRQCGKVVEYVHYLTISALTLDTGSGACTALNGGRCTIYERRPLACRAVPFHYSHPEASAERDLAAFVGTPGYGCDTSDNAPVVLESGRIVDPDTCRARSDAVELAARDRRWQDLIVRRLKSSSRNTGLPSLREIEANAALGVTTVSMCVAWRIAAEAGLIGEDRCWSLIAAQADVVDGELARSRGPAGARETLAQMSAEYRQLLGSRCEASVAVSPVVRV